MSIASTINAAIRQHKLARHMNTIHAPKTIKCKLPGCEASEVVYDNATLQSQMHTDAEDTTRTRILHEVRSMLDASGLNSALFEKSMLFDVRSSLSAAEYDDFWNLLIDPLFVITPDTLQQLLGLGDSTIASPRPADRTAIFYQ